MAVDAEVNGLGRIPPAANMMVFKWSHEAAKRAAFGGPSTLKGLAVPAHRSIAACQERRRMKLAAEHALGQHQAASVT